MFPGFGESACPSSVSGAQPSEIKDGFAFLALVPSLAYSCLEDIIYVGTIRDTVACHMNEVVALLIYHEGLMRIPSKSWIHCVTSLSCFHVASFGIILWAPSFREIL